MYLLSVTLVQKFAFFGTSTASKITLHPSAFSQVTWENSATTGVKAQEKHLFSNLFSMWVLSHSKNLKKSTQSTRVSVVSKNTCALKYGYWSTPDLLVLHSTGILRIPNKALQFYNHYCITFDLRIQNVSVLLLFTGFSFSILCSSFWLSIEIITMWVTQLNVIQAVQSEFMNCIYIIDKWTYQENNYYLDILS